RLCFVACSLPRTSSASSPTRFTYACKASRMARPHRYQRLIATLIKQKLHYGGPDGSMREGSPGFFCFPRFRARSARPDRPCSPRMAQPQAEGSRVCDLGLMCLKTTELGHGSWALHPLELDPGYVGPGVALHLPAKESDELGRG